MQLNRRDFLKLSGTGLGDIVALSFLLDGGWPSINQAEAGERYLPFIMKPEGVACLWDYGGMTKGDSGNILTPMLAMPIPPSRNTNLFCVI